MTIGDLYAVKRSVMLTEARAEGNPYHVRHVQQYCDYADAVGEKIKQEIIKELPRLVAEIVKQPKVQVEVDENSLRKVQQKVVSMLDSIFGRR